jgi:hypothetical protein
VSRTASGATDTLLATVPVGTMIPAGGYFVFAGTATPLPLGAAHMAQPCSYSTAAGGLGLRAPDGTLVDSVGYGAATNAFVEGSAVGAPAATKSASRTPNGTDTNNNSTDFVANTTPTPGASN